LFLRFLDDPVARLFFLGRATFLEAKLYLGVNPDFCYNLEINENNAV
jgi:hypothetical protein